IVDRTTGNSTPPPGARSVVVGQYLLELSGPQATLTATVTRAGGAAPRVDFVGQGYTPATPVGVWVTSPAQQVTALGQVQAGRAGPIPFSFQPTPAQAAQAGHWAATGQEAHAGGLVGVAWFALAGAR